MLDVTGHIFTFGASFSLGVGITELIAHLKDDYGLIRDWKFANISYFGARWSGLLTMSGYVAIASIGHHASRSTCHGVFVFAHVCCALNSLFSASIFWTRCGALCDWKPIIVVPLALYGIGLSAYALASSADDFAPKAEVATCIFKSLWGKSTAGSRLSHLLIQDQLIYIAVTMTAYLGLASSFLMPSTTLQGFGLLCPSIISVVSCRLFLRLKRKGKDISRRRAFPELFQESQDFPSNPNSKSSLAGSTFEKSDKKDDTKRDITHPLSNTASIRQLTSNTFSIQVGGEHEAAQLSDRSNHTKTSLHQWRNRKRRSESEPPKSGAKRGFFSWQHNRSFVRDGSYPEGIQIYQEVLQA